MRPQSRLTAAATIAGSSHREAGPAIKASYSSCRRQGLAAARLDRRVPKRPIAAWIHSRAHRGPHCLLRLSSPIQRHQPTSPSRLKHSAFALDGTGASEYTPEWG